MGSRGRKRLLIFILIPILSAVNFLTDDFILKLTASILLVVYVGFIIFLRDSMRGQERTDEELEDEKLSFKKDTVAEKSSYDTDDGEEFKIISPNKNVEVARAGESAVHPGKISGKSFFKPPDLKENFEKIANEKLPDNLSHDEHFSFILEKILNVIKEAYIAHTALFFWFNRKKEKLTLEKYSSSSNEITQRKFDLEDDILSKIVQKEEPELLTDIAHNAELDVIRYYDRPQGIKSFVGVPLFYGEQLAGVIAVDSKVSDAFGIETIYSLGRFVRVLSSIISLFDEKFTESQAENRLRSLLNILNTDKKFDNEEELLSIIESSVKHIIPWDVFTFVQYLQKEQKFTASHIVNKRSLKYVGEHSEVELNSTIVGKAIISGTIEKIDDTSSMEMPRFAKSEDVTFDGSFLAVPLIYDNQNFGVLCFESLKKNIYNNSDIEFLRKVTKIFSFIVYSYSNQSFLKDLLSVDVETKFLNNKSFGKALESELAKSAKLEIPGALALVKIDDFIEEETLFEGDPFPKVLKAICQVIREEITPLNIVGRLNNRVFGVYFFNSTTKDVFLWAEKLRIKIARKPIAVISKQTTFTVSIGVATTTNKTDVEDVVYNAELALKKAIEKGGNTVKSI